MLGHGSGKLFTEENIDPTKLPISPLTDAPVAHWYNSGETWDSKFSTIASSFEECRAECVGIYLCVHDRVQAIFGHSGTKAQDIIYTNWLNMARAGLLGLTFYSPDKKKWNQAHMWGRYVILQVMLEAGQGFVELREEERTSTSDDGTTTTETVTTLHMDREKIMTVGYPAVGKFLCALQVYKATGDSEGGRQMYEKYSVVNERFVALRAEVLRRKKPRKMIVQSHTALNADGSDATLQTFEASVEGIIQSFVARFPASDPDLLAAANKQWN